jgi:hypothetical protein
MFVVGTHPRVQVVPSDLRPLRQAGQEGSCFDVSDEGRLFRRRRPQHLLDLRDLVEVVPARKNRPVGNHFGQNAAHAPHVHRFRVALKSVQ